MIEKKLWNICRVAVDELKLYWTWECASWLKGYSYEIAAFLMVGQMQFCVGLF